MEILSRKEINEKYLESYSGGKEYILSKVKSSTPKTNKIIADFKKSNTKRKKKTKLSFKSMTKLKNGDVPATQKQINLIEKLLTKSVKKYDYYFPRDKYRLSKKIANGFIHAILKQEDFSFNYNTKKTNLEIRNYYIDKELLDDELTFYLNKD